MPLVRAALWAQPSAKKPASAVGDRLGRLLGQVVAGRQRVAAHVVGLLAPGRQHVVGAPDEAVLAPEREERRRDRAAGVGGVVLEVDRSPRRGSPRRWRRSSPGRRRRAGSRRRPRGRRCRSPRSQAASLRAQVELGVGADQPLGQRRRLDQEEPVVVAGGEGHVGPRVHRRRRGDVEHRPAADRLRGGRAPSGAPPARRGRGRRRRSGRSPRRRITATWSAAIARFE